MPQLEKEELHAHHYESAATDDDNGFSESFFHFYPGSEWDAAYDATDDEHGSKIWAFIDCVAVISSNKSQNSTQSIENTLNLAKRHQKIH